MILPSCKTPQKPPEKTYFQPPKKPPEKTAEPLAVRLDRGELDSTDGASDKPTLSRRGRTRAPPKQRFVAGGWWGGSPGGGEVGEK